MIEISFAKLMLLALVALVVLGPEKLPAAARTAGALLRRVRNGWDSVRSEVERELEVEEIRRAAREAAARAEAAQAEFRTAATQVETAVTQAGAEVKAAVTPPAEPDSSPASPAAPVAADAMIAPALPAGPDVAPVVAAEEATAAQMLPAKPGAALAMPTVSSALAVGDAAMARPLPAKPVAAEAAVAGADETAVPAEPDPQQELPLAMPSPANEAVHGRH